MAAIFSEKKKYPNQWLPRDFFFTNMHVIDLAQITLFIF